MSNVKVTVTLKEIMSDLCPKCAAKVRQRMRGKVTDAILDQAMGGKA